MPRTCEPTSILRRGPLKIRRAFGAVYGLTVRTPSMVVRSEAESPLMQQLRDSVSRARELAQRILDSVHRFRARGASDELHVADTPAPRV
jgi:hypothetical protein